MVGIADATQVLVIDLGGCYFRKERMSDAHRWIAGCVLDPRDLSELIEGWKSYCVFEQVNRKPAWKTLADLPDLDAWSGQQIWIDLSRRAIWVDCSIVNQVEHRSLVITNASGDPSGPSELSLNYQLPQTWLVTSCRETWENVAREQPAPCSSPSPVTIRSVLYEQVVEFIADELAECELWDQTVRDRWRPPTHWRWQQLPNRTQRKGGADLEDLLAEIHARWLMTRRDDLGSMSPRECLMLHRNFVDSDLWCRQVQWNLTGEAPLPMPRNLSRYDGPFFGTHEVVIYYELVRELLRCGAAYYLGTGRSGANVLVPILHRYRENWLATPSPNSSQPDTPKRLIDLERRRMPWLIEKENVPYDCECPICQMMAETPGLTFGHIDGSGLDFEWAFSLHDDRREWELENQGYPWGPQSTAEITVPEVHDQSFAPALPLPPPSMDELGSWPIDVLLLYIAREIRSLTREQEGNDEESIASVRELTDAFAQMHECVLDPGWIDTQTVIVRMFKVLTFWEATAGEAPELFNLATALDVLGVKLAERQDEMQAAVGPDLELTSGENRTESENETSMSGLEKSSSDPRIARAAIPVVPSELLNPAHSQESDARSN